MAAYNKCISRSDVEFLCVANLEDHGIRQTDSLNGLECFSTDLPPNSEFEGKVRGCVFNGNDLIVRSASFAKELTKEEAKNKNIGDYRVTQMFEGTIIRVFYFEKKWYVTTNRKLDAFKSKWGKISFGEIFEESVKKVLGLSLFTFFYTLNKDRVYNFLVGTTEETRVVSPACLRLILVECRENGELVFSEECKELYDVEFKFKTFGEAFDHVENLSFPYTEKGYGLFFFSENECLKISHSKYDELADLRHNLPSIKFAYIHNMFDTKKRALFRSLYPLYNKEFDCYDEIVKILVHKLCTDYIARFVHKKSLVFSKTENAVLYTIHGIYLEFKIPITENLVNYALFVSKPTLVNKLIAEWKKSMKTMNE